MSSATSYHLIDPDIHLAVEADHQPREARYEIRQDTVPVGETTRMLYWNGANVRSCTMEEWDSTAQAEIAEGQKRAAQRAQFRSDALAHVGKRAKQLTLPELRDLFVLYLERDGLIDGDGNLVDVRETL